MSATESTHQTGDNENENALVSTTEIDMNKLSNPCRCTLAATSTNQTFQAIFICRTCCENEKELLCVCEACANHCHEFHDELEYLGMGQAYCDCRNLGKCKLWEASQQTVQDWKFPVEGISSSAQNRDDKHYIMDAFHIQELQANPNLVQNLVDATQELIIFSKDTFWLDEHEDQSSWCHLEHVAWQIYQWNKQYHNIEMQEAGGIEWWVQVKQTKNDQSRHENIGSNAIDLHYDKDEELAEKFGLGAFPTLSTVTYLTDGCNPTVVFSRTYEQPDDDIIPDMFLSHPVIGKHLVFDGRLLHGAPAHPDLRDTYVFHEDFGASPTTNQTAKEKEKSGNNNPRMRVSLLVNIWSNRKPAGINPLETHIRKALNKKFHQETNKLLSRKQQEIVHAGFNVDKAVVEEQVLEAPKQHERDETRRIQLPFVCKGITWESEDDDSAGLVLVTCPPPCHNSDTIHVKFGSGVQAYLDQAYDAITQSDGVENPSFAYEDAYI